MNYSIALQDSMEFFYKLEVFHWHATILADVATTIPLEPLRGKTLQTIHREIELGGDTIDRFLEL